jgi:hypothetical protein
LLLFLLPLLSFLLPLLTLLSPFLKRSSLPLTSLALGDISLALLTFLSLLRTAALVFQAQQGNLCGLHERNTVVLLN